MQIMTYYMTVLKATTRFTAALFLLLPMAATAATYNIGPNQALNELSEVPWLTLGAGDEVNIHWRSTPYRTKVGIQTRGTAAAPIVIRGVANASGQKPVWSAENATTPASLNGFFSERWDEGLGAILIKRGPDQDYGVKPGHILIENIKFVGARNPNTYTNQVGAQATYNHAAAAVWAVLVENLTVRDCEISDNGNGLFVLSKNDEALVSRNILIEDNRIFGNGYIGRFFEHNIYTQAAGMVLQRNFIGRLTDGALGSSIKDRSSGTVVRYNWIESSARSIDLVDPEDSYDILVFEPNFHDTYVYGNVIENDSNLGQPYAANMIHYGGDTGVHRIYRKGTLHFYNNTVVTRANQAQLWFYSLFDLETNEETVEMRNNVIVTEGSSQFTLMRAKGTAKVLDGNAMTGNWQQSRSGFVGQVQVTGDVLSADSAQFRGFAQRDYRPAASSLLVDASEALPSSLGVHNNVNTQAVDQRTFIARGISGGDLDIGALELGTGLVPNPPVLLAPRN